MQTEQHVTPRAPNPPALGLEREPAACKRQGLTVPVQQRRVDRAVGDEIRRPRRNLEGAHAVRTGLVEASHQIERIGPVLMNEWKLRPGRDSVAEPLDRLHELPLLHQADALHVERPGSLGRGGVLQHVLQRRQRTGEFRRLFSGFLGKIVMCQNPRIDHAQHVLGRCCKQAPDVSAAAYADDGHAALVATAQRELVVVALPRDLPADVHLRDPQQAMDVAHDRLQRKTPRHL